MSTAELKTENERLKALLQDRESDNEKLRQQTIVAMFSSLEQLIKSEIEKVYLRLDTMITRIDTVNMKQEALEKQTIPKMEKQILELKEHTLSCPAPKGVIAKLEQKVDIHIAKTKWAVDIVYYKWVIRLMIFFFFGKSTFDIVMLLINK